MEALKVIQRTLDLPVDITSNTKVEPLMNLVSLIFFAK